MKLAVMQNGSVDAIKNILVHEIGHGFIYDFKGVGSSLNLHGTMWVETAPGSQQWKPTEGHGGADWLPGGKTGSLSGDNVFWY